MPLPFFLRFGSFLWLGISLAFSLTLLLGSFFGFLLLILFPMLWCNDDWYIIILADSINTSIQGNINSNELGCCAQPPPIPAVSQIIGSCTKCIAGTFPPILWDYISSQPEQRYDFRVVTCSEPEEDRTACWLQLSS